MADVTLSLSAKDVGVAATLQRLQGKLAAFQSSMAGVATSAKRMQGSFSSLGRSVMGLAAAYVGVTQAISAFNKAMDFGGRMNDLSEITGESAGNLAVLERAFDNTGVGGEKMMPMIAKMTEFIQNLEKGQEGAVATASKLGITFADLKNKTPIERFQTLLRAVAGLTGENDRLNASQDIFGTRMGGRLIPLIKNFSTEMESASKQLGSVVEILNRNSAGIDEFGDRVQKAIAAKPMEFMIGIIDQMTGRTQNLAKAISEIDAAGFGRDLAQMFSGAMKEPGTAFLAFGEALLGIMKRVGNIIVDAVVHAGVVYQKFMTDDTAARSMGQNVWNWLSWALNLFNRGFYSLLKGSFKALGFVGWPMADQTVTAIEGIQKQFDAQNEEIVKQGVDNLKTAANRFYEIAQQTPKRELNTFDVGSQDEQTKAAFGRLSQLGAQPSQSDQFFKQLNQIYRDEVEKIHAATSDRAEQLSRLNTLQRQYREKAIQLINQYGEPSASLSPLQDQMQQNTMSQPARAEAVRNASAQAAAVAPEDAASEPTLQRAVALLAELNTKLPQPVLV